ncbi:MAG TPA: pitrilysin family protein, partial [Polyangiaceae bacterium]|nr:pitrilysin family protein [Polyangiaceae bacterium]
MSDLTPRFVRALAPRVRARAASGSLALGLVLGACGSPAPISTPPQPTSPPREATPAAVEAFRASAPAPDARRTFAYPTPALERLDNGLTLYVVERDTPLVVASLVLKSGSTDDPAGKSGLAALTARMLTEGTRKKNDHELAEASEDLGSELSAAASYDTTMLDFEFLAEDMGRALDLMAEAFTQPRLDPAVFGRVKAQWIDQLTSERQEPATLAAIAGMRATLGPTWGAPTQGSLSGVRAVSVHDLTRFHRTHYHPDRAALVI